MTDNYYLFQYGLSADLYSLTIIIFELFSGTDAFPGDLHYIFHAKMFDKKPVIASDFPSVLKELIHRGWSKEPKERPPIEEFKLALLTMISEEEQVGCTREVNNTVLPNPIFQNESEAHFDIWQDYNELLKPGKSNVPYILAYKSIHV